LPEQVELFLEPSNAGSEDDPVTGQPGEGSQLLRQQERITQWHHEYRGEKPQTRGHARQRPERDERLKEFLLRL
jgi:hypothetical protein